MKFLNRLFPGKKTSVPAPSFTAALEPDAPIHVVGDIHGRADLLSRLVEMIDADAKDTGLATPHIVFVGDYVDRGEQSKEALSQLIELCASRPQHVTCLMGNHERMMLDFLDSPAESGARWLRNGGLQTLASFGVGDARENADGTQMKAARNRLREALPAGTEAWLRERPLQHQSGNVCIVHAAAEPIIAMNEQPSRTLLWGNPEFFKTPRNDGLWVVHGHTVVDEPYAEQGRIAVDTGAYFTSKLSAAVISSGDVRFLST